LSRFDLLFIFLDQLNPESDRQISEHVLRMHRYKHANDTGEDGLALSLANDLSEKDNWGQEQETPMYQKYDKLLHGKRKKQEVYSIAFIKKYLLYARFRIKPKLTAEVPIQINTEQWRFYWSRDSIGDQCFLCSPQRIRCGLQRKH
jgi:DNA replication licensing factor MCM3